MNCGLEKSHPCKTIHQATAHAHNGDVINIDGSETSRDPYPCESEPGLQIAGVEIRSYATQAFVACKNSTLRFSCDIRSNSSSGVSFIIGITFVNTTLYLEDCSLKLVGVSFVNSSVDALSLSFSLGSTGKIDFSGCNFYNNSGCSLKIRGDSVNLNIRNSLFTENKLGMRNAESAILVISPQSSRAEIRVNFTNITVSQNICPGKACFEIGSGNDGLLIMKMEEGKFESNNALESVFDIGGTSVIEFTAIQFRKNTGRAVTIRNGNSVQLKIMNGKFLNNRIGGNGGAVFVGGSTQKALVVVSRSTFKSNQGKNGGACAFVNLTSLTLDVKNCQFVKNEGWASGGVLAVGTIDNWQRNATINIHNSKFSGNKLHSLTSTNGGGGALAFFVTSMWNLTLTNNTFAENTADQIIAGAIFAFIRTLHQEALFLNCEFVRNSGTVVGTFFLDFTDLSARVKIQNSTFIQNKGYSVLDFPIYDIALNSGSLLISFCNIQKNSGGGIFLKVADNTSDVRVENSVITDNDNFTFFLDQIGSDAIFQFTNVSILRNDCNIKSSIFHVSMDRRRNTLRFQASIFEDNFCKSGVIKISVTHVPNRRSDTSVLSSGTAVTINDTTFRNNSGVAESALKVLDVEVVQIENSYFTNNFGISHMRVRLRSSVLTIYKTNFYQSEKSQVFNTRKERPYNGFLTVTSFGNISVRDSSFISDPISYDGKGLIYVKGAGNVCINDSVKIQSPFGSKLLFHNFTHLESEQVTKPLTLITTFSIITEPCSIGTYSIRRGTSKGFKMEDLVKCLSCPDGGNCTSALAARPNYWGYPIGDTVHFELCPRGYCCAANQQCPYNNASYQYSGCQGNRTGILCGRCKKNFSESLFNTNCIPVEECTHAWFLVVIFSCITLFALYLIRKPPVFPILMANLTWFIPSLSRKKYHDVDKLESKNNTDSDGYLKILFYFYQIAGLLTVPSYGVSKLLRDSIVLPVINLLDFKLYPYSDWSICLFPGFTSLTKTLFQIVIVKAIFLSILFIYFLHIGLNKLRKRVPVLPPSGPYLGAILETMLLGYSALTGTAMRLLDCVKIQHVSRWYYNAEITCLQWWQKASIVVIILYLFPFIFMLYVGTLRLHQRLISVKKFLLACNLPLPYLLHVFVVYIKRALTRPHKFLEMTSKPSSADLEENSNNSSPCTIEASVLEVLSAPFCHQNQNDQSPGKIYWESILIGRRFILILIGSFVAHAFLRSVCLAILCLIFLLHHLSQMPFVKFRANLAETVSLATLVIIAILNVGVASYYSAGIEASGVEQQYVRGFLLTEAVLLGFVPFVFVIFIFLSLASQLVRLLIILIQFVCRFAAKSKTYKQKQDEPLLPSSAKSTTKN